jgi:hypothetical protein
MRDPRNSKSVDKLPYSDALDLEHLKILCHNLIHNTNIQSLSEIQNAAHVTFLLAAPLFVILNINVSLLRAKGCTQQQIAIKLNIPRGKVAWILAQNGYWRK